LIAFNTFKQLENEGIFADERQGYLLSAVVRLTALLCSAKGMKGDDIDDYISCEPAVRLRRPTEADILARQEREAAKDEQFADALLTCAEGKVQEVSIKEFKDIFHV
jgi:hypothetical protein